MPVSKKPPTPLRIPVPGLRHGIGLGSLVGQLTRRVGVTPCSGCQKRASVLNRHVALTPWRVSRKG